MRGKLVETYEAKRNKKEGYNIIKHGHQYFLKEFLPSYPKLLKAPVISKIHGGIPTLGILSGEIERIQLYSKVIEIDKAFILFNILLDKDENIFETKKIYKKFLPDKLVVEIGKIILFEIVKFSERIEIKFSNCSEHSKINLFKSPRDFSKLENLSIFSNKKLND